MPLLFGHPVFLLLPQLVKNNEKDNNNKAAMMIFFIELKI